MRVNHPLPKDLVVPYWFPVLFHPKSRSRNVHFLCLLATCLANNKYQQSPSATIIDNEPQKIIAVFVDRDYHVCVYLSVYLLIMITTISQRITTIEVRINNNISQARHVPLASAFGTTATFISCGRAGGQTKSSQPPGAMYGWWSTEMVFKTDNLWLGTSIELINMRLEMSLHPQEHR